MNASRKLGTVAVLAGLLLASCSSSHSNSDGQPGAKHITVCTDFTDPPFAYVQDGEQRGSDPDIVRALAPAMNASSTMKDTRFSSLIIGLKAGRCDAVISFLYVNGTRANLVSFVPYAESGSGFLVRKNSSYSPTQVDGLCGHQVAVLQGGSQEQTALALVSKCRGQRKAMTVRSFPTDVAAVQDLVAGRVDVFYADNATAVYRAKQAAKDGLVVSNPELLSPVVAGIAVRKGDIELADAFTKGIAALSKSGKLQAILHSYGLQPATDSAFRKALARP